MAAENPSQPALDLIHRPALGAEDFFVADCNQDAVNWIDRWPEWPAVALLVYGPTGCGKTHLAQVWCHSNRAHFVPDAAALAEIASQPELPPALVIDDADQPGSEELLFHTYNRMVERGGSILFTARLPASRWGLSLADLRSRMLALPSVAMYQPDEMLMSALLVKLFADCHLEVDAGVINYLTSRIERSFGAAQRVVADINHRSLADRRRVTTRYISDNFSFGS